MKTLAEIAIDEKLVSKADVRRAAEVAEKTGVPLVVALVRELGVDELALVRALRRHARVVLLDPAETQTDAPELPPPVETVAREEGQVSRPPVRLTPPSPPAKPTQPAGKPASPAQNFAIRLQEDSSPGLGKFIENNNIPPASLDENYKNLPPVYPEEARKRGIQGTVGMTIRIGVDGKPLDIAIETSSGSAAR